MMIKILFLSAWLMLYINNIQADSSSTGIVQRVDLAAHIVEINYIEYQIATNKTRLLSGQHILSLDMLNKGSRVNFKLEGNLLIEIRLEKPPFEFNS